MRIKKKKSREWRRAYGTPTPHLTAVLHAVDNTGASDPVPRNPLLWNKILLDGENLLLEMKHKLYLEDGSKHSKSLTMTIASNEREIQVLEAAQKMLWSNAIANDMRGVRHLVKKVGIDVNTADPNCFMATSLHLAAGKGNVWVVRWLLRYGADPNARTVDGHTPLHWAASKGFGEIVRRLVRAGADLFAETYDAKVTPLQAAIINGHALLAEEIRDLAGIKHRAIR